MGIQIRNIFLGIFLMTLFCRGNAHMVYLEHPDIEMSFDAAGVYLQSCTPGKMCSDDCKSVEFCSGNQLYTLQNCTETEYCDSSILECGSDATKCVKPLEFHCADSGIFPDPTSCSQYYTCNGENDPESPEPTVCDSGTKFDVLVQRCTAGAETTCTDPPVPACKAPGDCAQLKTYPYMYYVCVPDGLSNSPLLFNCFSGNFTNTTCVCESDTTAGDSSSSPTTSSTTPTSTPTTSSTTPTSSPTTSTSTPTTSSTTPTSSPTTSTSTPTTSSTTPTSSPTTSTSTPTTSSTTPTSSPTTSTSSPITTSPTPSSTVTTTSSTLSSTTTSTTSTTTNSGPRGCDKPFEFYPIVGDTCHYCLCTQTYTCETRQCLPGTYFDAEVERCIVGDCSQ